ncbi:MAG: 2-C-methyl-D-erythritol 2,4-cyclodiphosphate synthase, partial [Runella zeae]
MQIDAEDVSIKATTSENIGFVGRKEGIAAHCVALIYK